ncbi:MULTISPECIES: metal ABC transporter ATP-binding protein [unclassified Halomonas]|uniref:metal ABC transporter ATP-binding protein n=1 Tax=unclassified Halomonas TaxID=2609666 RepID=UPI001C96C2FF|nr:MULTISPECIES: ATP-binding cassette domain-containing protein [unclassified Halomonas]MBY5926645.1 ATP-binding cassette domain-containing protein [Halomonas sp. DP4Y7-2]MBY6233642.1 ATP-binding cassette domain-containing protein [Halomonas sp. DP4Y7-1]
MSRLTLHDLQLARGGRTVLEHLEGRFQDGAITALIGANGAGKSTLIQAIMGTLTPVAGRVECDVPAARRAWLPQQLALDLSFPMSVEELIMTGTWPSHGAFKGYCGAHYRRGRDIMERLGISHLAHRPLGELSGGQRQRALIGRTLMQEAELLLLDEPFANVDVDTVEMLMTVLREMADAGTTLVIVLHDMTQLSRLADDVLVLTEGHGRWATPDALVERHTGQLTRPPRLPLTFPGSV